MIADALYALKDADKARLETLANTARIVTFGGRIKMPEAFTEVIDVVGELDWFGEINSRPKIATDIKVPFCGHSTNTDLPTALQVTRILEQILSGPAPAVSAPPDVVTVEPIPVIVPQAEAAVPEPQAPAAEPVEAESVPVLVEAAPAPVMIEPEPELPTAPLPEALETAETEAAQAAAAPIAEELAPSQDAEPAQEVQKAATPIMVPLPRGKTRRPRAKT